MAWRVLVRRPLSSPPNTYMCPPITSATWPWHSNDACHITGVSALYTRHIWLCACNHLRTHYDVPLAHALTCFGGGPGHDVITLGMGCHVKNSPSEDLVYNSEQEIPQVILSADNKACLGHNDLSQGQFSRIKQSNGSTASRIMYAIEEILRK